MLGELAGLVHDRAVGTDEQRVREGGDAGGDDELAIAVVQQVVLHAAIAGELLERGIPVLGLARRGNAELAAQHGREVPLFVKIAPDLDAAQIAVIAATLKRHGCDAAGQPTDRLGVIATNTTLNREAIAGHRHAEEAGGLSGKPVFALSNAVIAQLRAALGAGFPIIGAGGVASGEDAVALLINDLTRFHEGHVFSVVLRGEAVRPNEAVLLRLAIHLFGNDAAELPLARFLEGRGADREAVVILDNSTDDRQAKAGSALFC